MLSRLSLTLLKSLPQQTKLVVRNKVKRPDYFRYDFGPVHYDPPKYTVKVWELLTVFMVLNVCGLGPGLYLSQKWPSMQIKDEE